MESIFLVDSGMHVGTLTQLDMKLCSQQKIICSKENLKLEVALQITEEKLLQLKLTYSVLSRFIKKSE